MGRVRRERRRALVLAAGVVAGVAAGGMLAGCSAASAGPSATPSHHESFTFEQAEGRLTELPGVSSAAVGSTQAGAPGKVDLFVSVRLSDDGADAETIGDYALRLVWATTEAEPTSGVDITLTDASGERADLTGLFAERDLTASAGSWLAQGEMSRVYGSWPGAVPEAP